MKEHRIGLSLASLVFAAVFAFVVFSLIESARAAPPTGPTAVQAGTAPVAAEAATPVVPEFHDDWFYDQNISFRRLVGQLHTRPGPAPADAPLMRSQCMILAIDYNKKSAVYDRGVLRRLQLPATLDVGDCK